MEQFDLTKKTDREIATLMNDVVSVFFKMRGSGKPVARVGFLQLNKEAARRGLVMGKDKFGQIILEEKKEPV